MNDFEALVSLNLIPQIGSVRLGQLLKYFGRPQAIFAASGSALSAVVGERLSHNITAFNHRDLKEDLAAAKNSGIRIITFFRPGVSCAT
jgi:predicted Rossmann fold nucleotide-binding protein DprA/Smf involved in DNA uptake